MKNIIPRRSDKVAFRVVDNEAVLVMLENQRTMVLNEVGTRVWQMLDGQKSLPEIAQGICEEFEVTREAALEDCRQFVADMRAAHALTVSEHD